MTTIKTKGESRDMERTYSNVRYGELNPDRRYNTTIVNMYKISESVGLEGREVKQILASLQAIKVIYIKQGLFNDSLFVELRILLDVITDLLKENGIHVIDSDIEDYFANIITIEEFVERGRELHSTLTKIKERKAEGSE